MAPSGAEGEPAAAERDRRLIGDELFAVEDVTGVPVCIHLDADIIPMVGAEKMGGVGVFFQDWRTACGIGHGQGVAFVMAETGRGVVVAAVTEVEAAQTVALCESSAATVYPA